MNRRKFINDLLKNCDENYSNIQTYKSPPSMLNSGEENLPLTQNAEFPFNLTQRKKNSCNLWTFDRFGDHKKSASHKAKSNIRRQLKLRENLYISNDKSLHRTNNINCIIRNNTTNKLLNHEKISNTKIFENNPNLTESDKMTNQNESSLNKEISDRFDIDSTLKCSKVDDDRSLGSPKDQKRGQEMLIPIDGLFCLLCETFFPEIEQKKDEHCSSRHHCEAYEKLLKEVENNANSDLYLSIENKNHIQESTMWEEGSNKDRDYRNFDLSNFSDFIDDSAGIELSTKATI